VAGSTVLTAAHLVAGATTVTVRDVHKRDYAATLDLAFIGDVDGRARICRWWKSTTRPSRQTWPPMTWPTS